MGGKKKGGKKGGKKGKKDKGDAGDAAAAAGLAEHEEERKKLIAEAIELSRATEAEEIQFNEFQQQKVRCPNACPWRVCDGTRGPCVWWSCGHAGPRMRSPRRHAAVQHGGTSVWLAANRGFAACSRARGGCGVQEKLNYFWIVEKKTLEDKKSELRNKDRELQDLEEKHQVEIKVRGAAWRAVVSRREAVLARACAPSISRGGADEVAPWLLHRCTSSA